MKFLQSVEKKLRTVRNNYRRSLENKILKERWAAKPRKHSLVVTSDVVGLDRCIINFINLKHREDRKAEIVSEFKRLGVSEFARFDAISDQNGALGCTKSHAQLLKAAHITKDQLFMICEDDCQFVVDRTTIDIVIEEFFLNAHLDVLCLAYNAKNGFQISKNLLITSDTQTTSCYVVKLNVIDMVLDSALKSEHLLLQGEPVDNCAIDLIWKEVKQKIFFALPTLRCAQQRPSFSDIENVYQDYGL